MKLIKMKNTENIIYKKVKITRNSHYYLFFNANILYKIQNKIKKPSRFTINIDT